ncbi:cell wall synthesis protein CwsA [Mycolicibacterium insubricum]|nr:cell wall synthesis protein CwsA [Mycolicibacterium insubricum]
MLELGESLGVPRNCPRRLCGSASRTARRIGLITGIAVVTLAGGAVAFSIIRRSMQPDPSALPPSVEVDPHP